MSRRKRAQKRELNPDARYESVTIAKFIRAVMISGKKLLAERIVYDALEDAARRAKMTPVDLFTAVIDKLRPDVEVRSRRVGGATYQVPVEVRPERAQTLAFRWLIAAARKRSEKTMASRLAAEFLDASQQRGAAMRRREDIHKTAEANRAFAHYRW